LSGTTLSVTVKGPNNWEVIRKMKGRTLLTAHWTLFEDGKTLNDAFTQYLPDGMTLFSQPLPNGSFLFLPYVYARTAGSSGFVGTWDSDSATVKAGNLDFAEAACISTVPASLALAEESILEKKT
jgi:hypothetical protein